jgi:hypothetical protein
MCFIPGWLHWSLDLDERVLTYTPMFVICIRPRNSTLLYFADRDTISDD